MPDLKPVTTRLPNSVRDGLKRRASRAMMSSSALVTLILEHELALEPPPAEKIVFPHDWKKRPWSRDPVEIAGGECCYYLAFQIPTNLYWKVQAVGLASGRKGGEVVFDAIMKGDYNERG